MSYTSAAPPSHPSLDSLTGRLQNCAMLQQKLGTRIDHWMICQLTRGFGASKHSASLHAVLLMHSSALLIVIDAQLDAVDAQPF
eukprot:1138993-Pelagomonas_calceolata.AAC.8